MEVFAIVAVPACSSRAGVVVQTWKLKVGGPVESIAGMCVASFNADALGVAETLFVLGFFDEAERLVDSSVPRRLRIILILILDVHVIV